MISLLLALSIFLFFALIGQAVLAGIGSRRQILRGWLVAPTLGLSLVLLAATVLNQAGLPVQSFARPLFISGIVVAGLILWWRRPVLPIRPLCVFGAVLVFSLIYAGWPALQVGLNWVSYANDDMANYCLGAERVLHSGFFRVPLPAELGGLDYSQYFWFMHVVGLLRFGSEMLLAWVAGCTGLSPLPAFMPLILALSLVQVSATAALVLATSQRRWTALAAALLLALSPAFLMGTYYQLIAQVGGLALVTGIAALLFTSRLPSRSFETSRLALIIGIQTAALCIYYPEATPFLGLGYVFFLLADFNRQRHWQVQRFALPIYATLVAVVLLRYNVLSYLVTLGNQLISGTSGAAAVYLRFPFYLVPSGPANAFGFLPLAQFLGEPWDSVMVGAGFLMLVVVVGCTLRDSWQGRSHGGILFGMVLLGVLLFRNQSDFGLFKLIMFAQPFVACALAILCFNRNRALGWIIALTFCLLQLPVAHYYGVTSLGQRKGNLIELPEVSYRHIAPPTIAPGETLVTDTHNPIAAKFAALEAIGHPLYFLSFNYFEHIMGEFQSRIEVFRTWVAWWHPESQSILHDAPILVHQQKLTIRKGELFGSRFLYSDSADKLRPGDRLLGLNVMLDILNHSHPPQLPQTTKGDFFYTVPRQQPGNHLVFVPSSLGEHYYTMENPRYTSFYQIERDYFNPGGVFSSLGRFLLFRIENPSPEIYLKLSLTRSCMGPGLTLLDMPGRVLGKNVVALPLVGAGAANVVVGPVEPVEFDGASYIAIDFGAVGYHLEAPRKGLMHLYNSSVPIDWRLVVAFGRDLSAFDNAAGNALPKPRQIREFPSDLLQNPGLQFSGWFEDSWISAHSYAILARPGPRDSLAIRGMIPALGELKLGQKLIVTINQEPPRSFDLKPGDFSLQLPLDPTANQTRVELQFSRQANLPVPDDRPVAAKIAFMGLTAN